MADNHLHLAFDLDGTLIDSVADLAISASELVVGLGGRPLALDEVAMMVGEGAGLLVKRALLASGLDPETPGALPQFLEIYDRRMLDTTMAYPGVKDILLLASRRARLSVLTNKPRQPSLRILDALGLTSFFESIIGGDGPFPRKPAPDALRALASEATRCALIGDSPIDWQTAEAAGCRFIWARYGFGAGRFAASPATPYIIDRPSELAAVLDRLMVVSEGA